MKERARLCLPLKTPLLSLPLLRLRGSQGLDLAMFENFPMSELSVSRQALQSLRECPTA